MNSILRLTLCLILYTELFGCSSILDKNRGFTEPVTGAIMIVRDVFSNDKHPVGCDSLPESKRETCQKEAETLRRAIENQKNKE